MKILHTAVLAAGLSTSALAYPSLALPDLVARQDTHPFVAPKANWLRSPCPGTNTLANHGFINRNGRGISSKAYLQGFADAFNFGANISIPVLGNTFKLCEKVNGKKCKRINLDILNIPHGIEHDGSISRNDKKRVDNPDANNHVFNQTIWDMSLAIMGHVTHLDPQILNTVRLRRVEQDQRDDFPGWFIENAKTSLSEHAFILMAMNDPVLNQPVYSTPQARKDWVNYWFVNERLPTELGWVKPTSILTATGFGQLIGVINAQPTISATGTTDPTATTTETSSGSSTTDVVPSAEVVSSESTDATTTTTITPAPLAKRASAVAESQVPTIARSAKGRSAISAAAAYATSQAGSQPVLPNTYTEELSQERLNSVVDTLTEFVTKRQRIFLQKLAALLNR